MKKLSFIVLLCIACGWSVFAQTQQGTLNLREDNIEEILNAMTIEEKVTLLVGSSGSLVPGAAVNSGEISQEELDRNVRNILNYIVKTQHFRKYNYSNKPDLKAHAAVARKAAEESIILLKNEGSTLPLNGNEKVALYGISSVDFVGIGTGSGWVNTEHIANMQEAMTEAGFTLDENLAEYYRLCIGTQNATDKMNGSSIDKRHRPEPTVLAPGESETLTMKVSAYELASFNEEHSAWETAAGTYEVLFGASVADIRCTTTCKMKAQAWKVKMVW